jgi:hypothetical protein
MCDYYLRHSVYPMLHSIARVLMRLNIRYLISSATVDIYSGDLKFRPVQQILTRTLAVIWIFFPFGGILSPRNF